MRHLQLRPTIFPPRFQSGRGAVRVPGAFVIQLPSTTQISQAADSLTGAVRDSIVGGPVERVTSAWGAIVWTQVVAASLLVGLILLLAWLSYRALGLILQRIERAVVDADPTASFQEQRVRTIVGVVRGVGVVTIGVISLFMILDTVGLDIRPLLAGAGVVAIAISFGAQSIVKDVFSGMFILIENQFAVGDVIRIGDATGTVEKITLRIVVMRDDRGVLHIIPNGEIKAVSNFTRAFSRALIDIAVGYSHDLDRVMEVMSEVAAELWKDPEWKPLLTEEIGVLGVESFDEGSIKIRMVATTIPLKQGDVARELRRRLKRRFDVESIDFTTPARIIHVPQSIQPSVTDGSPDAPDSA